MNKLNLKVITPEKEIFSGSVDQINILTSDGELGILPNHTNLMAKVLPGQLTIKNGSQLQHIATGYGLLQIAENNLSILVDLAEEASNIDEKIVEDARRRAEDALEQKLTDEEYAETLAILERSLAQLKVKRRFKSKI